MKYQVSILCSTKETATQIVCHYHQAKKIWKDKQRLGSKMLYRKEKRLTNLSLLQFIYITRVLYDSMTLLNIVVQLYRCRDLYWMRQASQSYTSILFSECCTLLLDKL